MQEPTTAFIFWGGPPAAICPMPTIVSTVFVFVVVVIMFVGW